MKFDVWLGMKDVGDRIGILPRFGQVTVEIHLGVARQQAGKDECVEALGLAVGGETGGEVGGVGFDEEGKGGRVERVGAVASKDEAKQERGNENKEGAPLVARVSGVGHRRFYRV